MSDNLSTLSYTDLHYIPEEQKDEEFAAKVLWFNKVNSVPLVDAKTAKHFKDIDRGIIDANALKLIIDPVIDGEGGKAEFFASDWKANPIYVHLVDITEANLEKIPINLYCKTADGFSKLRQQKENDKIIMRRFVLNFVNEKNKALGYPLLKDNEDPYKYIAKMQSEGQKPADDAPMGITDNIKSLIQDNEDMALYNELIYKDAGAIGVEIYTKWILQQNKFPRVAEKIIPDIKNFNRAAVRFYTDKTTGRPIIEHLEVDKVNVTPFKSNDGDDISGWYIEYDVTFRDFVRMCGKNLSRERLEQIFNNQRQSLAMHGLEWSKCNDIQRDNARIRIGFHQFLTQNCEVFSKGKIKGNTSYVKKTMDWQPKAKTVNAFKAEREEKHYNVWYEHYYIPVIKTDSQTVASDAFEIQAKDVYGLKKVTDQQRYGNDNIFSKPSLVIWNSNKMSFGAIMDAYMPKIHLLWQQYQNDLANAMPAGLIFAEELLQTMVSTTDDGAKEGKDSKLNFIRKLKQSGYGIARLLTSDGKIINEGKPFVDVKTGHLAAAMERLLHIQELYNQCRQALGIDPVSEGVAPKPRQTLGGLQLALDAGSSATWKLEKGYMDIVQELGNRTLYHMIQVINIGGKRFDEMKDVVGAANGMALEALKDIPMQRMAMSIENINTDAAKARLTQIADQLVAAQALDVEVLLLMTNIDNYRYAAALMMMKFKERQRLAAQEKTTEFERQVAIKKLDIDFKKQDYINRVDAEKVLLDMSKKWDLIITQKEAELKGKNQIEKTQVTAHSKEQLTDKQHDNNIESKNLDEIVSTT